MDGTGLLYYHARYYDPAIGRFVSADSIVPGNASGGMDGVALKPLTTDFHEPGFVAQLSKENQLGPWFTLSEEQQRQAGSPWGPANPQALNRYSYVQNNPLRWTDPSGHVIPGRPCFLCDKRWGNIGSWHPTAKGAVVVGCVVVGCSVDFGTGDVWGPSTSSAILGSIPLGTTFSGTFRTAKGTFEYIVEGIASGSKFTTSEIAIYPEAGGTIEAGSRELMKMARHLIQQAKEEGFEELEIHAVRYYPDGTTRDVILKYTLK